MNAADDAIAGYSKEATRLSARYEALDGAGLLARILGPILPDLPPPNSVAEQTYALDIGAGTGRDARWLSERGFAVTAAEPVAAFREASQLSCGPAPIRWLDDRLPNLSRLSREQRRYALILSNAVWHHLPPDAQHEALANVRPLLTPGGRLVLSLRHGPTATDRPGYPIRTRVLVSKAMTHGLVPVALHIGLPSLQPGNRSAGVNWDWVVFAPE